MFQFDILLIHKREHIQVQQLLHFSLPLMVFNPNAYNKVEIILTFYLALWWCY